MAAKWPVPKELLLKAKQAGFSDQRIAELVGSTEEKVRALREEYRMRPCVKRIDTLAAEYPAKTNYLYMTYNGTEDDVAPSERGALILGGGAYRIGSSVEFDWCCVNAASSARSLGWYTIMVNCNPETVSTDFDCCDRLYFEELSWERVMDIWQMENPEGVMVSMGGQIPNNIAGRLDEAGVRIFGTSATDIDRAEDRNKFSSVMDSIGVEQPLWAELTSLESAHDFAERAGYPLIVRPSYVLSGAAMNVAWDLASLDEYLKEAAAASPDGISEHPVVLSKFMENSREIEVDAAAKDGEILYSCISEHIENAGVHSGDATVVFPAQRLYMETYRKVRQISAQIAKELRITGPFNVQFLGTRGGVMVIECNLRASRSFPFCSKVSRVNLIDLAVRAMLGSPAQQLETISCNSNLELPWVGVKAAQFSFARLHGADPVSGVEMASTGEAGCIGSNVNDAFLKAMQSVGYRLPQPGETGNILLSTGPIQDKLNFLDSARKLASMGYKLYASHGTAKFLSGRGVSVTELFWPLETTKGKLKEPNIATFLASRKISLVINIPKDNREAELRNDYQIRRAAIDFDVPLITNVKVAKEFIDALDICRDDDGNPGKGLEIKSWAEYR
jgi:carbamoyl-phosphate synthase large subunit